MMCIKPHLKNLINFLEVKKIMKITDISRCIRNAYRRIFYRNKSISGVARFLLSDSASPIKGERIKFEHDSNSDSFHWRFDKGNNQHIITSSEKIHKATNVKTRNSLAHSTNFFKEVYRHELCHALYTKRDLESIVKILEEERIPFALFNLFEDARIEYKFLQDFPIYKKFFWNRYFDIDEKTDKASGAFFVLKAKESMTRMISSKSNNLTRFLPELTYKNTLKKRVIYYTSSGNKKELNATVAIANYYKDVCNAPDSWVACRVVMRWVKTFGIEIPEVYKRESKLDGKECPLNGKSGIGKGGSDKGITDNIDYEDILNRGFDATEGETNLMRRIYNALRPICKRAYSHRNTISTSGNRLYIKNAIARLENSFRSFRKSGNKLKVFCLVDFSTSMNNVIKHYGGKEFLGALKMLHDNKIIELRMVISFNQFNYDITNNPLNDLMNIEPCGGHENFDNNLKKYDAILSKQDLCLLFTDGYLTGNIPDEPSYRKRGINLIASCICDESEVSRMRDACNSYFTKSFIDTNALSVSKRILEHCMKAI
jgi:hypothetical protein